MSKPRVLLDRPICGVAVDQGSGLGEALRRVRGAAARDDDLLTFKRMVVRGLSAEASTLLVDATYGERLLPDFDPSCERMLAYEADVYRISNDDRMTVLPDNLRISDYARLGVRVLKFFLYFGPNDDAEINSRKFELVRGIGRECAEHHVAFLFEPIVYDRAIPDEASQQYARAKPGLVEAATRIFADPSFGIDILKVEIPVNLDHVAGFGPQGTISQEEAKACFRTAFAAAGDVPLLYLSGGVSFDRFLASLRLAKDAGVNMAGFMCGRAIWSDAISIFGAAGPEAAEAWIAGEGRRRLERLREGVL